MHLDCSLQSLLAPAVAKLTAACPSCNTACIPYPNLDASHLAARQHMANVEFDTWVPYVRQHVPRTVVLGGLVAGIAYAWHYARDQLYDAAFYLALLVAGNLAMWRMEIWTADADRAAIRAGVATRGWGVDPSRSWLDRFRQQREIEKQPASKAD